ncbi:hypothetical protein BDN72DRAFT_917608 [Pluteus cervinus]|uniref:Uncharacterized protein n=1 Tax=Pluteus cervinus TaxID=181527 RepID=A0ACD2ZXE2_9AGAR|nr:hypothetical protein BDN72DRAFT_917608 [Pluteus cervinus]
MSESGRKTPTQGRPRWWPVKIEPDTEGRMPSPWENPYEIHRFTPAQPPPDILTNPHQYYPSPAVPIPGDFMSPEIRQETVEPIIPLGQEDLASRLEEIITNHPFLAFERDGQQPMHMTLIETLTRLNQQDATNREAMMAEIKAENRGAEVNSGSPMNVDSRFEAMKVLLSDERKESEENQARECQAFEEELGRRFTRFREEVASEWEEKEREMTKQRDDFVSEELGKFARAWELQETYETLLSHGNPQTNATWRLETQREVLRQRSELKKMEDCCKDVKNKLAALQANLDKQGLDIKDLAALKVSEAQRLARVPEYPPRSQSRLHKPSPLNFTPINTFPTYNPYTVTPATAVPKHATGSSNATPGN